MKNQIVEIIEGSIDTWGERNANDIAEEILDLLKEEDYLSPEEIAKEKMGNTLVMDEWIEHNKDTRILQSIYDSEINFSITTYWDEGLTVKLGDEMNGFSASALFDTFTECVNWLLEEITRRYPKSRFATEKEGKVWKA